MADVEAPAQSRVPAQPPSTEVPVAAEHSLLAGGPLAAKVHAVQVSDGDRAARAHWEVVQQADPTSPPTTVRRVRLRWRRRYTALLVAADLLAAVLTLAATSQWARTGLVTAPGGADAMVPVLAVLFVVALTLGRVYEHRFLGHGFEEYRRLGTAGVSFVAIIALLAYAVGYENRALVLVGAPLAVVAAVGVHVVARQLVFLMRRRGRCQQRVVVIGLERSVAELARTLQADPHCGLMLVGACVSRSAGPQIEGVPVLGTPADTVAALARTRGDTVLLTAWSDVSEQDLRRLSWSLEGTGVQILVAPRLTEVAVPRMHVQTVSGRPLLVVDEPEFTGLRRVTKGLLDYGLALFGLLLVAPVMIAVAVAVKLDSPGPVFFRQERVGRDSRPFRMTKFRSMYVDAEERKAALEHLNEHAGGPLFKVRDDPRVTRVGRVLRRYSLDELPQLFDVLSRSMSLVGPRPPLPREVASYEDDARRRLLVKPGITGLWQVSGRSDLTWEESVRLDLSYVENWSLLLDLTIIARTVVAVVSRRGAY